MSELVADTSGTGPAVVLLHGQPGSRGDWAQVTRRLKADFLVIAPDRPGYGETGGRARGFRGNAAAVLSLLDRLGVPRAIVVGFSWAGGVAMALAEEAPGRVTGLVLVSSIAPGEPLGRLDRALAVPPIGTAVTAGALFLANGLMTIPPVRRALVRRQGGEVPMAAGSPDAVISSWLTNRVWRSFVTEQRCLIDELPSLDRGLSAVRVPTVVLVGDSDHIVAPATGRRLVEAIPGSRLVELPGAGHMLTHQRPDAVAAAVRAVCGP